MRYDYGQLSLLVDGTEGSDYAALVDQAIEADGISQSESQVVVLSPHQWNPDLPLTVELVGPDTEDDLAEWDEAFEAGLRIGPTGFWFGSAPDGPQVRYEPPPGGYRILITGRGFTTHGWPGPTPADVWRLRFVPTDDLVAAQRLARWEGPAPTPHASGLTGPITDEQFNELIGRARYYWTQVQIGRDPPLLGPAEWQPAWEEFIRAARSSQSSAQSDAMIEPPEELLEQLRSNVETSPAPAPRAGPS